MLLLLPRTAHTGTALAICTCFKCLGFLNAALLFISVSVSLQTILLLLHGTPYLAHILCAVPFCFCHHALKSHCSLTALQSGICECDVYTLVCQTSVFSPFFLATECVQNAIARNKGITVKIVFFVLLTFQHLQFISMMFTDNLLYICYWQVWCWYSIHSFQNLEEVIIESFISLWNIKLL